MSLIFYFVKLDIVPMNAAKFLSCLHIKQASKADVTLPTQHQVNNILYALIINTNWPIIKKSTCNTEHGLFYLEPVYI